ncbi:MAG: hypothetical protein R6V05_12385 [Candidatus Brocadiia bacterium]
MGNDAQGQTEVRSDEELWDAYCAGDEQALRALVGRYRDDVYWYLLLSTGRPDEAARHCIQTWVLAARHARPVEGFGSFRAWLFAVATQNTVPPTHPETFGLSDLVAEVRRGPPDSDRGRMMTRLIEMHRRLRQPLLLVTIGGLDVENAAQACNYTVERTVRALERACRMLARSGLCEPQEGADEL